MPRARGIAGFSGVSGYTGTSGLSAVAPIGRTEPELPKPPEIVLDTEVVCIHNYEDWPWAGDHPVSGGIYKVVATELSLKGDILFLGLESVSDGNPGWNAIHFRPIKIFKEKPADKNVRRVIRCEEEEDGSNS